MLFLDKPRTLDLMIAHAEQVCVPAPFAARIEAPRERPSLLQGPPLPVVLADVPVYPVPADAGDAPPPSTPLPARPRTPVAIGARGWTAA